MKQRVQLLSGIHCLQGLNCHMWLMVSYYTEQHRYKTPPSLQKVLLDSIGLDKEQDSIGLDDVLDSDPFSLSFLLLFILKEWAALVWSAQLSTPTFPPYLLSHHIHSLTVATVIYIHDPVPHNDVDWFRGRHLAKTSPSNSSFSQEFEIETKI